MKNSKYLANRPFLIAEFRDRPKPNANTRVKGWMTDPANIETHEHVSVVDRIGAREQRASVIIDVIENAVVKNTRHADTDDQSVIAHYVGKYADMIKESLNRWAQKQIASGMAEHLRETKTEEYTSVVQGGGSHVEVLPDAATLEPTSDVEYFKKKLDAISDDHSHSSDERFG